MEFDDTACKGCGYLNCAPTCPTLAPVAPAAPAPEPRPEVRYDPPQFTVDEFYNIFGEGGS